MGRLPLFWIVAALCPAAPAYAGQGRTYLASITGIALGPNQYVDRFTLDTWGVAFVAVCHFPFGWEIRAGRMASLDGVLAGQASHGVTFLNRARLGELHRLALIRIDGPVQRHEIRRGSVTMPATFAGRAEIGTYGTDEGRPRRQVRLTAANIRLVPAASCPPPPR